MKEGDLLSAFILSIILQNTLTLVPAPFNVEVTCHNFETVAYWNYDKGDHYLRPLFKVQILKDINNADSETIDTWLHHQNISSSITHIHDSYYVNVTAMNGSEISASAVSPEFSYHKYLPAVNRCMLDFPNVALSVKGGQITFTFPHPFQVYKDTPAVKNLNRLYSNGCEECKNFKYNILHNGTDTLHNEKICKAEVCHGTFKTHGNNELYCISLSGTELNTDSGILCQHEETQTSWMYFVFFTVCILVTSFLALIAIGVIAFSRTKKTMPSLPKPLAPLGFKMHPANTLMPKDFNGEIVQLLPSPKLVLLTPKEVDPADSPSLAKPQEGSRFLIGQVRLEEWGSSQEVTHLTDLSKPCPELWSDQCRQWGPTREEPAEDCGDSPLSHCFSGYDRSQVLEIEISPGDIVKGYGPHDLT